MLALSHLQRQRKDAGATGPKRRRWASCEWPREDLGFSGVSLEGLAQHRIRDRPGGELCQRLSPLPLRAADFGEHVDNKVINGFPSHHIRHPYHHLDAVEMRQTQRLPDTSA